MKNLSVTLSLLHFHVQLFHLGDGVEARVLLPILYVECQAAKHQHAHEDKGEEET